MVPVKLPRGMRPHRHPEVLAPLGASLEGRRPLSRNASVLDASPGSPTNLGFTRDWNMRAQVRYSGLAMARRKSAEHLRVTATEVRSAAAQTGRRLAGGRERAEFAARTVRP